MSETINEALRLLQEENRLQEIVRLVGFDSISDVDKLKLEIAKSIREDYLQQNAYITVDAHSSLKKQYAVLKLIIDFYRKSNELIGNGIIRFSDYYTRTVSLRERVARVKFIPETEIETIDTVARDIYRVLEKIKLEFDIEEEAGGQ